MTILDQLAGHARERVAASKSAVLWRSCVCRPFLSSKEILGLRKP